MTPRDAAHTCVHSDKQYCLLRKPSLNTMSSFRTEIGPSPGAPAYHNLLWQQHFYTHDNTVYLDCKLLCGRHPLSIAYFLNVQVTSHPQICMITYIGAWCLRAHTETLIVQIPEVKTRIGLAHRHHLVCMWPRIFLRSPAPPYFSEASQGWLVFSHLQQYKLELAQIGCTAAWPCGD